MVRSFFALATLAATLAVAVLKSEAAPPMVIRFDPGSLTSAEAKGWYDQGHQQGLHLADKLHAQLFKDRTPTPEEVAKAVKAEMEDRQTAILAAAQSGGANSRALTTAFGRRDGLKEGLAKNNIAVPADAEGATVTLDEALAALYKASPGSAKSQPGEGQSPRPGEEPSGTPSDKEPSGGISVTVWLFLIVFVGAWTALVVYFVAFRHTKTILCRTCGQKRPKGAAVCPHCGHQ